MKKQQVSAETQTKERKVTKTKFYKDLERTKKLYSGWTEQTEAGEVIYHSAYVTKNYDFFNRIEENRFCVKAHITKMLDSIMALGVCSDIVVVEIEELKVRGVVDGQHRLEALKRANASVVFKYVKVNTLKEAIDMIIKMNNTSKKWGVNQYVETWKKLNPHYQTLDKYVREGIVNITLGAYILSNTSLAESKKSLRTGDFKVKLSKERINDIFNAFTRLYTQTGLFRCQYTTRGFFEFMKDKADYFDKEVKFLKKVKAVGIERSYIKENGKGFQFASTENAYDFFEECWS